MATETDRQTDRHYDGHCTVPEALVKFHTTRAPPVKLRVSPTTVWPSVTFCAGPRGWPSGRSKAGSQPLAPRKTPGSTTSKNSGSASGAQSLDRSSGSGGCPLRGGLFMWSEHPSHI